MLDTKVKTVHAIQKPLDTKVKATIKATTPSEAEVHTNAEMPVFNAKSERSQLPIDGSTING